MVQSSKLRRSRLSFFNMASAMMIFHVSCFWLSTCVTSTASADDWPQINGPNRNGVASGEKLLTKWPEKGPEKIWSHPVGEGFAGPAVQGEALIIFHRPGKSNLCEALNAKTGKMIWKKELPSSYRGGGPDGDLGPKCVPLIYNDCVYLVGTGGILFCLKMTDGTIVWKSNVQETYQSPPGYFGSGSSPIVIDGKLLVNVGGREAAVVAFDLATGKEVWKSLDDRASYSSPIEINIDGKQIAVFVTRFHVIGLNVSNGKEVFKTEFGVRGPSVNGAMPVAMGDRVFVNSAYGVGAKLLDVSDGLKIIWENDKSFSSQYSTPVLFGGRLYGTAGREDFGNGTFRCLDPETGNVYWSDDSVPVGHSILVQDKILCLDCKGGFHVIKANSKSFKSVYQTRLFQTGSRAMPALSNGMLFARSNAKAKIGELVCFQVGNSN